MEAPREDSEAKLEFFVEGADAIVHHLLTMQERIENGGVARLLVWLRAKFRHGRADEEAVAPHRPHESQSEKPSRAAEGAVKRRAAEGPARALVAEGPQRPEWAAALTRQGDRVNSSTVHARTARSTECRE